jgi:hypothetical protein
MDDLPKLTDALQARLWAAFQQIHHHYRQKQIGLYQVKREAYIACTREGLSPESSVAMVVHWGRELKWLPKWRVKYGTGPRVGGYFAGFAPASPPSADPVYQPIPEAEQRAEIAKRVADLMPVELPPMVALLDRVVRKRGIKQEQWATDHHIGHTTIKDWKAAGGKPSKHRVSEGMARKIEALILEDARELGF